MTYRTGTIKRARRTKAEVDKLDDQIISVLHEDHPQSVRHVFYRMTDPRLAISVPKTDKGTGNGYRAVQDRMVKLRRSGRLPYGWVSDATRRGYHTQTFRSAEEFLRRVKSLYRADLWASSAYYCEVWVESRPIAGVIEDDCRELAVSLYPAGGFSSITLAFQSAEAINMLWDGREVVIFYIGDYDPAGVLIDVAIEKELRKHLRPEIKVHFIRLGITAQQIAEYDLPTKPRKVGDKRAQHIAATVEAEAMPAFLMRELLRSNIESLLPEQALRVAKVEEESARDYFETLANISGGAA